MKKHLVNIFIIFISLLLIQCNKSNAPIEPEQTDVQSIIRVINFQGKADTLLHQLLLVKDTSSAKDSVFKFLLKNSDVEFAEISSQGISIKFKNGIIGGIMIDPQDYPQEQNYLNYKTPVFNQSNMLKNNIIIPKSKKTIFLNPHNYERKILAQKILDSHIENFPKIGFDYPEIYVDSNATIEKFTSLSDYGIVHIYSHGYAWPAINIPQKVYLMTGSKLKPSLFKEYYNDLVSGRIALISHNLNIYFFLRADYFASKNNFSNSRSIVYGGFCYSNLSGWPNAIVNISKAAAYTGFTYAVRTNYNADWAISLFSHLTDNKLEKPTTIGDWFSNSSIVKSYYEPSHFKIVEIMLNGNSNLALWEEALNIPFKVSPDSIKTQINKSNSFTAVPLKPLNFNYKFIWNFGDGSNPITISMNNSASHTYKTPGNYNIFVQLLNDSNKVLSSATASVEVEDTTTIINERKISATVRINALIKVIEKVNGVFQGEYQYQSSINFDALNLPMTINKNNFSGSLQSQSGEFFSVTGSFNNDTTMIISCEIFYQAGTSQEGTTKRVRVNNFPVLTKDYFTKQYSFQLMSTAVCSYISDIFYENNVTSDALRREQKLISFDCPWSIYPLIQIELDF